MKVHTWMRDTGFAHGIVYALYSATDSKGTSAGMARSTSAMLVPLECSY